MTMLAIWDDGGWEDLARIAVIVLVAYLLVMWIAALVWTYRDISARTRDPFTQGISVLMVLFFNLPGLLLYLILRPNDTLADAYDRQLEAEALLSEIQEQATCPSCRRKIENEFIACPYCRTTLRAACESCSKPLAFGWVVCPYCGSERPSPVPIGAASQPSPVRAVPQRPAVSAAPAPDPTPSRSTTDASRTSSPRPAQPPRIKRASTATYTPPARQPQPPAPTPATDAGTDGP